MLSFMEEVQRGQTENIKYLIDGEVDLNNKYDLQGIAMLISANKGHAECVKNDDNRRS